MAVAMRAKKIRHYSAPTHTVFSSKRIYRRNWYISDLVPLTKCFVLSRDAVVGLNRYRFKLL